MSATARIQALRDPYVIDFAFRYFVGELANKSELRDDLLDHLAGAGYSDELANARVLSLDTHYVGQWAHPSYAFRRIEEPIASISTAHITKHDADLLDETVSELHRRVFPGTVLPYDVYGWMIRIAEEETPGENTKTMLRSGFSDAFVNLIGKLDAHGFNRILLDADAPRHPHFPTFDW